MTRFLTIVLFTVLLTATAFVFFFLWQRYSKPDRHIPFERKVRKIELKQVLELPNDGFYHAGHSRQEIYLGQRYDPLVICSYTLDLSLIDSIRFGDMMRERVAWRLLRAVVDSPSVSFFEYLSPAILTGNLDDIHIKAERTFNEHMTRLTPFGNGSYLYIRFSKERKVNEIAKMNVATGEIHNFPSILEKQKDGVFCTDGMINFDKGSGLFSYTYFYRNQFIIFDSTGRILARPRTIDTVSVVVFDTVHLSSKSTTQIDIPPVVVNKRAFMSGSRLYLQSTAMTTEKGDHSGDPVDVYSVETGKYLYSCYVPEFKGRRMDSFFVAHGSLFVFYSRYLVHYRW